MKDAFCMRRFNERSLLYWLMERLCCKFDSNDLQHKFVEVVFVFQGQAFLNYRMFNNLFVDNLALSKASEESYFVNLKIENQNLSTLYRNRKCLVRIATLFELEKVSFELLANDLSFNKSRMPVISMQYVLLSGSENGSSQQDSSQS